VRIDPRTRLVDDQLRLSRRGASAPVPASIAATERAIWILNRNTASVVRIDPEQVRIADVISIGIERVPNEIVGAGRTAWVANEDGTLSRLDEGAGVSQSLRVGESLREIAPDGPRLWVGTAALDQQLPGGAG
jgi:hypothetical protein